MSILTVTWEAFSQSIFSSLHILHRTSCKVKMGGGGIHGHCPKLPEESGIIGLPPEGGKCHQHLIK